MGALVVPQYLQRGGSTLAGLSAVGLSDCISVPPKCAVMSVATTTTSWSKYDQSNNDYNTNKAEDRK